MKKLILFLILLNLTVHSYGTTKEYGNWESYEMFIYGSLVDLSYEYNKNSSFNFEAVSVNLPLLAPLLQEHSIGTYFYFGSTLYSLETNTKYVDHSFLSCNFFIKLFNLRRHWYIDSEKTGGDHYIFSLLYLKYEPFHITNRTDYKNPQIIKIGNETGFYLSFGSIIAGFNYQYDIVNDLNGIGVEFHYRLGGPLVFPTR